MSSITFPYVVTLGPEGTFSDKAARQVMNSESRIDYKRTFPETLIQAEQNSDITAVVPIENSVAGIVEQVQDLLVAKDLVIIGEINISVRYALLGNTHINQARTYYAHPQANGQSLNYINQHFPHANVVFTNSNIEAGNSFLEAIERGEYALAIVPVPFADKQPSFVRAIDIQDYPNNTTRFLVVQRRTPAYMPNLKSQKSSVFIEFTEDRSGLLFELLSIFQRYEINLCRLESRPSKVTPWFYVFYVDFTNNENTAKCLEDLERSSFRCKFLGSYDLLPESES